MKTFQEFANESVKDLLQPKSEADIKKALLNLNALDKINKIRRYNLDDKFKSDEEIKKFLSNEYGGNTPDYYIKLIKMDLLDINDPNYKKYILEDYDLTNEKLFHSVRNNDSNTIKKFAEWGINLNIYENTYEPPSILMAAFEEDNLEIAELLLKLGVSPEIENVHWDWRTCLIWACYKGYDDVVELLLNNGADPNYIKGSKLPLMVATEYGYEDVVELLLNNGADPNIKINDWTSLMKASKYNRKKISEILLNNGADPNIQNGLYGKSSIDFARPKMLEIFKKYIG